MDYTIVVVVVVVVIVVVVIVVLVIVVVIVVVVVLVVVVVIVVVLVLVLVLVIPMDSPQVRHRGSTGPTAKYWTDLGWFGGALGMLWGHFRGCSRLFGGYLEVIWY